jgi:hypothetical protein
VGGELSGDDRRQTEGEVGNKEERREEAGALFGVDEGGQGSDPAGQRAAEADPSNDPADPDQRKKLGGDADDDDERARGNRPMSWWKTSRITVGTRPRKSPASIQAATCAGMAAMNSAAATRGTLRCGRSERSAAPGARPPAGAVLPMTPPERRSLDG